MSSNLIGLKLLANQIRGGDKYINTNKVLNNKDVNNLKYKIYKRVYVNGKHAVFHTVYISSNLITRKLT